MAPRNLTDSLPARARHLKGGGNFGSREPSDEAKTAPTYISHEAVGGLRQPTQSGHTNNFSAEGPSVAPTRRNAEVGAPGHREMRPCDGPPPKRRRQILARNPPLGRTVQHTEKCRILGEAADAFKAHLRLLQSSSPRITGPVNLFLGTEPRHALSKRAAGLPNG